MELIIDIPRKTIEELLDITGEDTDIEAVFASIRFTLDNY